MSRAKPAKAAKARKGREREAGVVLVLREMRLFGRRGWREKGREKRNEPAYRPARGLGAPRRPFGGARSHGGTPAGDPGDGAHHHRAGGSLPINQLRNQPKEVSTFSGVLTGRASPSQPLRASAPPRAKKQSTPRARWCTFQSVEACASPDRHPSSARRRAWTGQNGLRGGRGSP